MTVTEAMKGITPDPDNSGFQMTDEWILAFKTAESQSKVGDYTVVYFGISEHSAAINSDTTDKKYIRQGKSTIRTDAQRVFTINGDRYHDETTAFFDWVTSHKILFGTGRDVITDYAFFNMHTGKGETGKVSINVTGDVLNEAGNIAGYGVTASGFGNPTEYTYTAS